CCWQACRSRMDYRCRTIHRNSKNSPPEDTILQAGHTPVLTLAQRLAEAGIEPSVGSKGDSYDNALAETINGLYKAELIHRRAPWKTREAVELATLEWVSWFNHHRLMEPLGYIPPAEAEANYYRQLSSQAVAA
uniref:integrase core domain-containing protein n=1 Tax=Noviherbaspirillum malthae TaxID=1260987 RepID=UPI001E4F6EFC